jgi:DNA-binding SARP family transcriptional activator
MLSVYRYHPLFHAFLLEHAEKLLGEQMIGDLRRRGAALLAGGGQLEAAFDLLVQVGDGPACVELVERAAPQLVGQGRRVTLLDWIALLPEDVVRTSPWLLFWKASCMLGFAPLVSAELLDAAIGQFRSRGQLAGARLAWSARVAACVHAGTDLTPIDHWLDELPALERDAAEVSVGHLLALFRQPGHPQAEAWTREAFERWRSIADPSTRAMTAALLIATYCFSGELGRAAIVLDLLRRGERAGEPEPLAQVTLCNGEAVFAWATADNVGCLAAVQRGLDIAAQTGLIVWNDQLSALGAAATLASGDPDLAEPFISRMREAASRGTRFTIGNHQFYAAWEAALRGDLARARAAIDVAVELADALGYPVAQVTSRIARAHLFLQADKDPQPELAAARAIADASRSPFLGFSCAFAEACITQRDEAIAAALGLGRSLGIYNVFWWLRDRVARLCERALEHGIEPTYVNELIRRHGLTPVEAQTSGAWPYPVRIRSLGGLAIEVDGAPIALPAKGPHVPLRLLAAIIALGGRDVPEARIIEAVWPDADGAGGRTVLQTTLHRLRRLLGNSDALTVRAGVVTLDPQVVWLDMWAVGHACTAIERAVARADHGELVARIDGLLATYGGPLLGDDDSTAVTVAARVRLRDRITRTVIAAGSALEARGELGRARALYEAALERDESAEVLYQRLMSCLERAGEAAEALRLFERCEAALASRLGQGPSKQTREIRERIHRTLAL